MNYIHNPSPIASAFNNYDLPYGSGSVSYYMRVALGIICFHGKRHAALPLLLKLMRTAGNTSKLDAAHLLMKTIIRQIPQGRKVRLLVDAWYMKGPLLSDLMREKIAVIGQVRRDTALYLSPPPVTEKRRGRPRKYGERMSFERFKECCPLAEQKIVAYGEVHLFQFYTLDLKVRFLEGAFCRVVCCRFLRKEKWTNWIIPGAVYIIIDSKHRKLIEVGSCAVIKPCGS